MMARCQVTARWEVRAGDDLEEAEVGLPLVADYLAACEAADGDDHDLKKLYLLSVQYY